jgi:SUR7/PalI family
MRAKLPSTRGRQRMASVAGFFYFVATVFLLLVNIGQVSNRNILNQWYFFRFDVSNVVPQSVPNAALVNSIATTIGLHDYYDVGMWNFCEGYYSEGVTDCSKPVALYWFDPVTILQSQLLRGASSMFSFPGFSRVTHSGAYSSLVELPSEVTNYLTILRTASQAMFIGFLIGVIASFVATVLALSAVYSKIWTILLAFLGWCAALAAFLGAGISTGMWTIFSSKLQEYASDITIVPTLGVQMFVFQWVGAGSVILAALIQTMLMCCGTSRRDVRKSAYSG